MINLVTALLLAGGPRAGAAGVSSGTTAQHFLSSRTRTALLNFAALATIGLAIGAAMAGGGTIVGICLVTGACIGLAGIISALTTEYLGQKGSDPSSN